MSDHRYARNFCTHGRSHSISPFENKFLTSGDTTVMYSAMLQYFDGMFQTRFQPPLRSARRLFLGENLLLSTLPHRLSECVRNYIRFLARRHRAVVWCVRRRDEISRRVAARRMRRRGRRVGTNASLTIGTPRSGSPTDRSRRSSSTSTASARRSR